MSDVETIVMGSEVLGIVIRGELASEGANFVTPPENSLQVGILTHRQGVEIKPHVHIRSPRLIQDVQEVLHIVRGVVEVLFYDAGGVEAGATVLRDGDTVLLRSGGHSFRIVKDAKIVEVKQGPYQGVDEDKHWLIRG